jgi:predicted HAD superfamily phosphohydrolase YqeG
VRAAVLRATDLDDVLRYARELSVRTLIFDVEPLVAYWDGGQEALDQGVAQVIGRVAALPDAQVVCFATNSLRRPSVVPKPAGVRVVYLASANKPLRTAAYRGFPRPGMVIGDQVATDGILARRLGYTFVLVDPRLAEVPAGPRLMGVGGRLVRPLLFTRAGRPHIHAESHLPIREIRLDSF